MDDPVVAYRQSMCRRRLACVLSAGTILAVLFMDEAADLFGGKDDHLKKMSTKGSSSYSLSTTTTSGAGEGPLWQPQNEGMWERSGHVTKYGPAAVDRVEKSPAFAAAAVATTAEGGNPGRRSWHEAHEDHHAQKKQQKMEQQQRLNQKERGGGGGEVGGAFGGRGGGWREIQLQKDLKRAKTQSRGGRYSYSDGDVHSGDDDSHAAARKKRDALPVYDYGDEADNEPDSSSSSSSSSFAWSTPAFEALECRESVIDFVINATDVKDECEGLRKAFDKTCSARVMQQQQQQQRGQHQAKEGGGSRSRRGRRVLMAYGARYADGGDAEGGDADVGTEKENSSHCNGGGADEETLFEAVGRRLRRLWRRVKPRTAEEEAFLFAEDEVVGDAWYDAVYAVRHGLDLRTEYVASAAKLLLPKKANQMEGGNGGGGGGGGVSMAPEKKSASAKRKGMGRRRLAQKLGDADGGKRSRGKGAGLDIDDDEEEEEVEYAPVTDARKNKNVRGRHKGMSSAETFVDISEDTLKAKNDNDDMEEGEEPRRDEGTVSTPVAGHAMLSPKLPTALEHVDDQMLNDAVLLTEGGTNKDIAAAVQKRTNATNANATDAAVADAERSSKAVSEATAAVSAVLNDPDSVEARTCCASILNVFHENCDNPEVEDLSDRRLFLIVFVIAFCGMVKSLIRHFRIRWLPEAAGCILVGVLAWVIMQYVPHFDFGFDGDMFLRLLVPPIVFEAALSIDKKSFQRHVIPIILFAVAGTFVSTVLTAYIVHAGSTLLQKIGLLNLHIPFVESLLFGALISSIDPIAVLSVLSNMGMTDTDTIYVLIFGESLLNDGVAIVLFQTLVHFLDESLYIDGAAVGAAVVHFLVVAIGSLTIGVASGMCCTTYYYAMRGIQTPLVEMVMFICWAFIPYYICDGVEWSGIVSVVAAGFVMDLFVVGQKPDGGGDDDDDDDDDDEVVDQSDLDSFLGGSTATGGSSSSNSSIPQGVSTWNKIFSQEGHMSEMSKSHIHFVTQINATLMETAIFAYLGLFLFSSRYHWNFLLAVLSLLACLFSRGVMVPVFSQLFNWLSRLSLHPSFAFSKLSRSQDDSDGVGASEDPLQRLLIDKRMQVVLWFAGLRGAMSFALVENIPLFDTVTKQGSRFKPELKAMTSACIVFTVFVLGGSTYYLMEYLGMSMNNQESDMDQMGAPLMKRKQIGAVTVPRRKKGSPVAMTKGPLNGHRSDRKSKYVMRYRNATSPSMSNGELSSF